MKPVMMRSVRLGLDGMIMMIKSSRYENDLLLDSPCAKQEGEQVTQQQQQTTQERKKNQELVCLNIAANIAPCHLACFQLASG